MNLGARMVDRMESGHWLRALVIVLCLSVTSTAALALTSAEILAPGPYPVGFMNVEVYDAERDRTLPLLIFYPAWPGSASYPSNSAMGIPIEGGGEPHPLLVYSHGFSSILDEGVYLTSHLAAHGYVTIAPLFPFTNLNAPGGSDVADLVNQPGDVSFVIDKALEWNKEVGHPLRKGLDPDRIGALGLSLGAATSLLVTYHPSWFDDRIKAVAATAPPITDYFDAEFYDNVDVPVLFNFSALDAIVDYQTHGLRALAELSEGAASAQTTPDSLFNPQHLHWRNDRIEALLRCGLGQWLLEEFAAERAFLSPVT